MCKIVQYTENSQRKDLNYEEVKRFYENAGIVLIGLNKALKKKHKIFFKLAEFTMVTCDLNASNALLIKNFLERYVKAFDNLISVEDDNREFKDAFAYVVANGNFKLKSEYYISEFSSFYASYYFQCM